MTLDQALRYAISARHEMLRLAERPEHLQTILDTDTTVLAYLANTVQDLRIRLRITMGVSIVTLAMYYWWVTYAK